MLQTNYWRWNRFEGCSFSFYLCFDHTENAENGLSRWAKETQFGGGLLDCNSGESIWCFWIHWGASGYGHGMHLHTLNVWISGSLWCLLRWRGSSDRIWRHRLHRAIWISHPLTSCIRNYEGTLCRRLAECQTMTALTMWRLHFVFSHCWIRRIHWQTKHCNLYAAWLSSFSDGLYCHFIT